MQITHFAIVVYGGPYGNQGALSALNFIEAALEKGHMVDSVFFYGEGVHNATALGSAPQDEFSLYEEWKKLGISRNIPLHVCVASAIKRGILDKSNAIRYEKSAVNVAPHFTLSGLGQLAMAFHAADKVLCFGNKP